MQEVWERATGPAIAAAARPTAERDGVLTVTCEAAVWAQELELMAGDLVPALNAALGAETIRELRCRDGLSGEPAGDFRGARPEQPSEPRFPCNLQGFRGLARAACDPAACYCYVHTYPAPARGPERRGFRGVLT